MEGIQLNGSSLKRIKTADFYFINLIMSFFESSTVALKPVKCIYLILVLFQVYLKHKGKDFERTNIKHTMDHRSLNVVKIVMTIINAMINKKLVFKSKISI